MEEAMRAILEEQKEWLQQQIEAQNARIAAHHQRILEQQQQHTREQQQLINQQNQQLMAQILEQLELDKNREDNRPHTGNPGPSVGNISQFNPKIEFPVFDGLDPKGWVTKCTRYFGLCKIHDNHKVDLASLYLKGPAEQWFGSYILGRRVCLGKSLLWMFVLDLKMI